MTSTPRADPPVRWIPASASSEVASTRLRCLLPSGLLAAAGVDSAVATRRDLFGRPDVVVFQKAYRTHHRAAAALLRTRGARIVLDLCDNHFADGPGSTGGVGLRRNRRDELLRMIDLADTVSVSTPTLAGLVEHPDVVVVDDAVEWPSPSPPVRPVDGSGPTRLLWFGNAGNEVERYGLTDLAAIMEPLEAFAAQRSATLTVVSNSRARYAELIAPRRIDSSYVAWSPAAMAAAFAETDIVVLPINDGPFARVKTANRLVTTLLHGVPAVVGRLASFEEFGDHVLVGDWEQSLLRLADEPELGPKLVGGGRAFVARRFADEVIVEQWKRALGLPAQDRSRAAT